MAYTHTFNGLTAGQVNELIEFFGDNCHHWDKTRGVAKVDFDSEEEAHQFIQHYRLADGYED